MEEKTQNIIKSNNGLTILTVLLLVGTGVLIWMYKTIFPGIKLSSNYQDWYVFAYLLAPITNLITVIVLIYTLINQRDNFQKQINVQRQFEEFNTVHKMVDYYNESNDLIYVTGEEYNFRKMLLVSYMNTVPISHWGLEQIQILTCCTGFYYGGIYISVYDHLLEKYEEIITNNIDIIQAYIDEELYPLVIIDSYFDRVCINAIPFLFFSGISDDDRIVVFVRLRDDLGKRLNSSYQRFFKNIISYLRILSNFDNSEYKDIFLDLFSDIDLFKFYSLLFAQSIDFYNIVEKSKIFKNKHVNIEGMNFPIGKYFDTTYYNKKNYKRNTKLVTIHP